jgi:putative transposase
MPRKRRFVAVDFPHHITHRGYNRNPVFLSPDDRNIYLESFFYYATQYQLSVLGYCLMTNHVHFIVVPHTEESMAQVFGHTQGAYSRRERPGKTNPDEPEGDTALPVPSGTPLWQSRFYSKPLDFPFCWHVLAYVERNPVRAGMVKNATDYPWSTAKIHCAGHDPGNRIDLAAWRESYTPARWREVLATSIGEEAMQERMRQAAIDWDRRAAKQAG